MEHPTDNIPQPGTAEFYSQLDRIFYPKSVAVIGASRNMFKWGSLLMYSLLEGGYEGNIYPINPKEESVYNVPCLKSILDIPGELDLAFITVPADRVFKAVDDCGQKGAAGVVVITSGFSETGKEGRELEADLLRKVHSYGMRLIGPNTMGIINTHFHLQVTGSALHPTPGSISLISQSGNLGTQVLHWAIKQGIGIDKFIGSGNEADLSVSDFLDYLSQDQHTNVILIYLEGVDEGRKFLDTARAITPRKPIIALKGGRTEAGSKAAASHTGSMAGSRHVYDGVFRQAGIICARNPSELLDLSSAFSYLPIPKGNNVGIISLGGGWAVVAADECNERGLNLPTLSKEMIERMDKFLPPFWSRQNPMDLVGQVDPEIYRQSLETMLSSDIFDSVIALGCMGSSGIVVRMMKSNLMSEHFTKEMAEVALVEAGNMEKAYLRDVANLMKTYNKPVILISLYDDEKTVHQTEEGHNIISYRTPERAGRVLQKLVEYGRFLKRVKKN